MSSPRENDVPRDAVIVSMILESMGITEYEPRVVNQYIELLHRYTRDILKDALTFAEHAGRASLELDDVRLAIHNRVNHTTHPVSREVLLELAQQKNIKPLPVIDRKKAFLLPKEDGDSLLAPNYIVKVSPPLPTTLSNGTADIK